MEADVAICLSGVSKAYKLYNKPADRLREALHPLKKQYHTPFYALRDIDLRVNRGEVLGIVGVNGAGKSTLLKIISGVLQADTGRVQVEGTVNALLELGAALKPEMTGRQNIRFNLQISGAGQAVERLSDEVIEFAGLGQHLDQPVKSYSSGMKARLGFAIATATEPDILIVDEVLAVGDILFQRKCYKKIEALFNKGKTIIFVSHSAQTLIEFCTRAVLLYERRIILDADPKTVTDFYQRLVLGKNQERVLGEIRQYASGQQGTASATVVKAPASLTVSSVTTSKAITERSNKVMLHAEAYLPGLRSDPQLEQDFAAAIQEVMLLDVQGRRVNQLATGESYRYVYQVCFGADYEQVSFGMHIKTFKGMGLASSAMHFEHECIEQVKAGETYEVCWTFDCHLLAGIYLTNAGVFIDNGVRMTRIVDACIFQVQVDRFDKSGLVDLNQSVKFKKVEKQ